MLYFLQINKELATLCNGQKPESIILIGVETHVCVENTAIDLRQYGYDVHTVADCCSSRTQEDRLLALEVCSTIKHVLFNWISYIVHLSLFPFHIGEKKEKINCSRSSANKKKDLCYSVY